MILKKKQQVAKPFRAARGGTRKSSQQRLNGKLTSQNDHRILVMPTAHPTRTLTRTLQFAFTADASADFTVDDLRVGCGGLMAATTTAGYALVDAIKLNRVKLYTLPNTFGSSDLSTIRWASVSNPDIYTPLDIETAVVFGLDQPTLIDCKPPKNSMASFWKDGKTTNTAVLFSCATSSGSMLELTFSYQVKDKSTPGSSTTLVAATVGAIYHKTIIGGLAAVVGLNSI